MSVRRLGKRGKCVLRTGVVRCLGYIQLPPRDRRRRRVRRGAGQGHPRVGETGPCGDGRATLSKPPAVAIPLMNKPRFQHFFGFGLLPATRIALANDPAEVERARLLDWRVGDSTMLLELEPAPKDEPLLKATSARLYVDRAWRAHLRRGGGLGDDRRGGSSRGWAPATGVVGSLGSLGGQQLDGKGGVGIRSPLVDGTGALGGDRRRVRRKTSFGAASRRAPRVAKPNPEEKPAIRRVFQIHRDELEHCSAEAHKRGRVPSDVVVKLDIQPDPRLAHRQWQ